MMTQLSRRGGGSAFEDAQRVVEVSHLLRMSVTLAVMSIWRGCVRDEVGVRIAPAAIACQHIRPTLFDRAILAIPMIITVARRYYCAPRRGACLSRLQTTKAHSGNSNDGDGNRAHQILVTQFLSQVNCP